MNKTTHTNNIFVLYFIGVFIYLASKYINMPGIYYDEITFVNAALGGIGDNFIYQRLLGIPTMMMPYIGALKSWMYYPVFKVFGISAVTIRLPVILISACSLWVWYLIGKKLFANKLYPILLVVILATDPAFIFQSKLDWGPIVIQVFLMTLSIYFFLKIIIVQSTKSLWPLFFCLLLGIYNKLNFIWFVSAFGIAIIIFYSKTIFQLYRENKSDFILIFSIFGVLLLAEFIFLIIPAYKLPIGSTNIDYLSKFIQIIDLYKTTMDGSKVYNYIIGNVLNYPSLINYFSVIIFFIWCPTLFFQKNQKDITVRRLNKYILFFLTIFFLIFLQIALTKQAGGPHHIMMLWPLHILIMSLMLSSIIQTIHCPQWISRTIFIIPTAILVVSQLLTVTSYEKAFRSNTFSYKWSPKIYQLADYINKNSIDSDYVISVDWGTHNQLFALAPSNTLRGKYIDYWPWFTDLHTRSTGAINWFDKTFFQHKKDLIILYSAPYQIVPNVRDNFFWFAKKYLQDYKLVKVINDEKDKPLYEVYRN